MFVFLCVCARALMLSLIYYLLLPISRDINFLWKALISIAGLHQYRIEMFNSAWLVSGLQTFVEEMQIFLLFVCFIGFICSRIEGQRQFSTKLVRLCWYLYFYVESFPFTLLITIYYYCKVCLCTVHPRMFQYVFSSNSTTTTNNNDNNNNNNNNNKIGQTVVLFDNEWWLGLFWEG